MMSRLPARAMANDMNRMQSRTSILAAALLVQCSQPVVAQMRTVATPRGNSDAYSVLLGENFRAFTDRVLEQPMSRDNLIYSCDFVYDARTRKTCVRSLNVVEVGDPGDIRFWRMPGQYPNAPDRLGQLANYALVGQIGASGYTAEGRATAYETVLQFFTRNNGTGYLCLSAATGVANYPRNGLGRQAAADEAICHVMLLYTGTLVVGADTDPQQLPPYSLVVKGNLQIEGCLRVGDATFGTCLPSVAEPSPPR
jgi:hypothetical protein